MGNCLVLEEEASKIKSKDARIMKCHSPLKAHQVLPKFPGQERLDGLPPARHLNSMADMQSGHLLRFQPKKMQIKETSALRIKLVISKQELKALLEKDGLTLEDLMSQIQKEPRQKKEKKSVTWKPDLESISEANGLF